MEEPGRWQLNGGLSGHRKRGGQEPSRKTEGKCQSLGQGHPCHLQMDERPVWESAVREGWREEVYSGRCARPNYTGPGR